MSGELVGTSARKPARKLQPGDVLGDGAAIERVELSVGKRSTSRVLPVQREGGYAGRPRPGRSGAPIHADVVRVFAVGGDPRFPRRFWPKQEVEVRDGE